MRRALLLTLVPLAACDVDRAITGDPDLAMPDLTCLPLPAPKIDVLFMVDNSNSVLPIQEELFSSFAEFIKPFNDFGSADLHIGVVTSDYGAGATGAPGCKASPGGQLGWLQATGVAAPNGCAAPASENFVRYVVNGPNNLPMGQDLLRTLVCMASVGQIGCGFEHPLESVYAALHNNLPANAGFLRPEAVLLVIFVTNEDDCSGTPDTQLFDKNLTATYGYEDSFRCTRFGLTCAGKAPPYGESHGPLGACVPTPAGPDHGLYGVDRYIDFFTRPASQGGLKDDPLKVVLAAIDAPSDPVEVLLSDPGTPNGTAYARCGLLNEASNPPCVPVVQHSCEDYQRPGFSGDPAVRLNTVVASAPNHRIHPICGVDFGPFLRDFAQAALTAATCR
jgi:hypothetical protein